MSKLGDIAAPPGQALRIRVGLLIAPFGLLVVWAIASPFLHGAADPTRRATTGVAAER